MPLLTYHGAPVTVERIGRVARRKRNQAYVNARRWLGYKDFQATTPWGSRMKLGFNNPSSPSMATGTYEPEEMKVMEEHVQPGMTVLDVGANIGYVTLLLAWRVGPAGRVHAFEPNPRVAALLEENLALNPELRRRVTVHRTALGSGETQAEFFAPVDGLEGVGGLRDTARAQVDRVLNVEVRTLDRLVADAAIDRVDFIKMDVEGGERDVLLGATQTLRTFQPQLLFEAYDGNTSAYGYRVFELLSYLEERGYEVTQAGVTCNFLAVPRATGRGVDPAAGQRSTENAAS